MPEEDAMPLPCLTAGTRDIWQVVAQSRRLTAECSFDDYMTCMESFTDITKLPHVTSLHAQFPMRPPGACVVDLLPPDSVIHRIVVSHIAFMRRGDVCSAVSYTHLTLPTKRIV